jgi:hypothetical protein
VDYDAHTGSLSYTHFLTLETILVSDPETHSALTGRTEPTWLVGAEDEFGNPTSDQESVATVRGAADAVKLLLRRWM